MELITKIVDFHKYCPECKYNEIYQDNDPCDICLSHTVRDYSHKPIKFEPKEDNKNG